MLFILNGNGVPSVAVVRPLPGAVGGHAGAERARRTSTATGGAGSVSLTWTASDRQRRRRRATTSTARRPPASRRRREQGRARPPARPYTDTGLARRDLLLRRQGGGRGRQPQRALEPGERRRSTSSDTTPPTVSITRSGARRDGLGTVTVAANAARQRRRRRRAVQARRRRARRRGHDRAVLDERGTPRRRERDTHADRRRPRRGRQPDDVDCGHRRRLEHRAAADDVPLRRPDDRADADYNIAGLAEAFRTTAIRRGRCASSDLRRDRSAATAVIVGLYTDDGGHPGALLAQGTLTTPVAGAWNDVARAVGDGAERHVLDRDSQPGRARARSSSATLHRRRRRDQPADDPRDPAGDVVDRRAVHRRPAQRVRRRHGPVSTRRVALLACGVMALASGWVVTPRRRAHDSGRSARTCGRARA